MTMFSSGLCHLSILHLGETPAVVQMLSAKQGNAVNTVF